MAYDTSVKKTNYKSLIAKRLVMFSALNTSRPRTELGQPVLYEEIRQGTVVETPEEKSLKRKSIRTVSDPDIKASLVLADEQFFKNEPFKEENYNDWASADDNNHSNDKRKSVKELLIKFGNKPAPWKQDRTKVMSDSEIQSPLPRLNVDKESDNKTQRRKTETASISNGFIDKKKTNDDPSSLNVHPQTTGRETTYVNCSIVSSRDPKSLHLGNKSEKVLTFVDDYYSKIEDDQSVTNSNQNCTSSRKTSKKSVDASSDCSSLLVLPQDSPRGSVSNNSVSNVSDFSDEGWDSDEFDDFSSDDDEKEESGKVFEKIELPGPQKKIYNIVTEMLTTERAYVKRLDLLEEYCQRLLKEAKENNTIPEKVVNAIFPNLSSIRTFHKTVLLPDLEKRMETWVENQKIGDIFKYVGHFLKMYAFYVKNFDESTKTLHHWIKKSPKFASIIEEVQKLPQNDNLTLQHHMLEPIQRVPRYKLLLQDYLKKLPEDHEDRAEAEASLTIISEAAAHANESMKMLDIFKKLMEIQERIFEGLHGESLITASRRFIKEGELYKIAARSDKRTQRVLILFNDVILCCSKMPSNKLKVKQVMDVDGMSVRDGNHLDLCDKFSFRIKSRQRILDLACSSEEVKTEWVEAITSAIADFLEKRGTARNRKSEAAIVRSSGSIKVGIEAPFWIRDDDTIMCMLCASRFWFINRRHHCRGCGRIVCESCSKYKCTLEYAGNISKRVCYACFKKLSATDESASEVTFRERELERDKLKRTSGISCDISGDLHWKQPGKSWTRGYCVLSEFILYIYKKKQDVLAALTIPLPGYSVDEFAQNHDHGESNPKHSFSIKKGNIKEMTYFFQAESDNSLRSWLDMLKYAVKAEKPPPKEIIQTRDDETIQESQETSETTEDQSGTVVMGADQARISEQTPEKGPGHITTNKKVPLVKQSSE